MADHESKRFDEHNFVARTYCQSLKMNNNLPSSILKGHLPLPLSIANSVFPSLPHTATSRRRTLRKRDVSVHKY